jgi:hypothetical protein
VVTATETAIAAATHLTDMDAGVVAALRVLARKLDELDRPLAAGGTPPRFDNVTLPTYLKYCEALGLTPLSRGQAVNGKGGEGGGGLGEQRDRVPRPVRSA